MFVKKTLFTLDIPKEDGIPYAPEISALTLPLMKSYADKIGADFCIIKERKFPNYPVTYEKFQVYGLTQQQQNDWTIFFDLDALIHPDFWDVTAVLDKSITASFGTDFTPIRFKPDKYFLRHGLFQGKGNWCGIFSDWCTDYYHPLDDLTLEEAVANITPTAQELSTVITPSHLIDDYVVSRNISKYGLKHVLIPELEAQRKAPSGYIWHHYLVPVDKKVIMMKKQLMGWAAQLLVITLITDPNSVQILNNTLNAWNGQSDWKDYLLAVPQGTEIIRILKSWGIPI
jgi:hypothetical protein